VTDAELGYPNAVTAAPRDTRTDRDPRPPDSCDESSGTTDDRGRTAEAPSDITARGFKDVAIRVKDEVGEDHVVLSAAGVAFFGFLAIIPALAAVVSVLGLITSPDDAADRAEDLFATLPPEARDLLTTQLETISGQADSALSFGLVVSLAIALWSASSGMGHLISAVNAAYDETDRRGWFARKAMALLFTVGAVVFVLFALGGLAALPAILDAVGLPSWLQLVYWPLLLAGFAIGLSILYRYAPFRDEPEWRWVSWGSAIAVVLWLVASLAFRIYAANFANYDESYGSLGAVVILLLWLLITAFVVLLGAEINAELEHQTLVDSTEGHPEPMGQRDAVMADTVGRST
jgi:membrane protein